MQSGKILRQRYKIIDSLGSGGFGDTYLAEDLDLPGKPKCVVKHLSPKIPDPGILPVAQKLFEREAKTLYKLGQDSDQIPKLFAHFQEGTEFYLVQEYIEGQDISKELTPGKKLSESYTITLLKGILSALEKAHQKNIIHRDIKPENLMRRKSDNKIVLIDFGAVKEISVLTTYQKGTTTFTVAVGTPGYMILPLYSFPLFPFSLFFFFLSLPRINPYIRAIIPVSFSSFPSFRHPSVYPWPNLCVLSFLFSLPRINPYIRAIIPVS